MYNWVNFYTADMIHTDINIIAKQKTSNVERIRDLQVISPKFDMFIHTYIQTYIHTCTHIYI